MVRPSATCSSSDVDPLPDIGEELVALRESARAFLSARSGSASVRKAMDSELGFDPETWAAAVDLGWAMVAVPEEFGGIGLGDRALAALMFEMGRTLFCGPFLSSVGWALPTLLHGGTEAQKHRWAPELASGTIGTVVELSGTAVRQGDTWSVCGQGRALDGHVAEVFLVRTGGGTFLVRAGDVERRPLRTMDQTRRLCHVGLDVRLGESARLSHPEGDGSRSPHAGGPAGESGGGGAGSINPVSLPSTTTSVRLGASGRGGLPDVHAMVALAAEQAGGASACVDMAAEYAGVRRQFGKPIGAFQAVAHKCADMFVWSTSAWSAAESAAGALDAVRAGLTGVDAAGQALVAKTYASDAYFHCAAENIQVHGGIGFTWEHDAHLHFKRARAGQGLFGAPRHHRESIAASLLD